jgi:predicted alpha/beta-hydrolase family hydrolase
LQHYPAENSQALLVLAHGAGAGERHPFMVAMARGLAERRVDVVTFEFPYMREKRKVPDKAPVLEAAFREAVREALQGSHARLRQGHGEAVHHKLFIGGKSMGGRMATHLAAQGLDGLSGVVVFGYPLHPPGKPNQLRVEHLPNIRVPMLVVQGARDAFGTESEIRPVFESLPAAVALHVVADGDHSLAVPKSGRTPQKDVYATVLDRVAAWIHST